jgi:hypothetical protein
MLAKLSLIDFALMKISRELHKSNFSENDLKQLGITCASDLDNFSVQLNCCVSIANRSYGDSFETYRIIISATCADMRRIAIVLLKCAIGDLNNIYIPIKSDNCLANGIMIIAAKQPEYPVKQPRSFTYTSMRKIKRYPWYPWSLTCNALIELPGFGIIGVPGERDHLLNNNSRDLNQLYAIQINGYPKGLIRLARLLLDYANTDTPPDSIDLEIEGGFRGVAPCSYEARFEIIDN